MARTNTTTLNRKPLRERFAATDKNWGLYSKVFTKGMAIAVNLIDVPILGNLIKKLVLMDGTEKHQTQAYTFDINHKLNNKGQTENVVLPVDIIRKTIIESEYRAIMYKCLCRTGENCQTYRTDLGCIFIGKGAIATVNNGVAREATVEEALDHLDTATGLGLSGMGMWIEVENYVWGIKKEHHHKWLEICFCCPCCCIALKNIKKVGPDIQKRFRNMGWIAAYKDGCTQCGDCIDSCSIEAIKINNENITISNRCLGCGICTTKCPENAIEMKSISPGKEKIQDYFTGFKPDL